MNWYNLLYMVGGVTCIAIIIFFLSFLVIFTEEGIKNLLWRYKYKHRFDKPPIAKCYCKDCEMHAKNNKCALPGIGRYTPDNGFCYEAEPMKREVAQKRGNTTDD